MLIEDKVLTCPACNDMTTWKCILESKGTSSNIYFCLGCELRRLYPQPTSAVLQGMYQKLAQSYSVEKARLSDKSVGYYDELIKKYYNKNGPKQLLDIGAGLGYYSESFAKLNYIVTYCDADNISSGFAIKNHKHINRFVTIDFENYLSTSDDKFDVIFCRHVIEHIFEPEKFIQGLMNLLKEDGILILETDNNNSTELLDHEEVVNYWGNYYLKNFKIDDIAELKKIKVTAVSEKETHWWAFRRANLKMLLENNGYNTLLLKDYRLGDEYLWPNVTPITSVDNQSNEGAGILIIASRK